jgi:hypothetical protein
LVSSGGIANQSGSRVGKRRCNICGRCRRLL